MPRPNHRRMDGGTVTVRFSPSEREVLREKRRAAGAPDDSAAIRAAIEAWEPGAAIARAYEGAMAGRKELARETLADVPELTYVPDEG
jgi:hypothetical protein